MIFKSLRNALLSSCCEKRVIMLKNRSPFCNIFVQLFVSISFFNLCIQTGPFEGSAESDREALRDPRLLPSLGRSPGGDQVSHVTQGLVRQGKLTFIALIELKLK